LVMLRTMIHWAMTVKALTGDWLIEENPLRGFKLPRELNPRRPIATYERFECVRRVVRQLATEASTERDRARWIRLELALVLAEATGRRIGAIRGLRWPDFRFDPPSIRWRAEHDKRRREQVVPIPDGLAAEIKAFQVKLGAVGDDWVFRQVHKQQPWHRTEFDIALRKAERKAELEPLLGGLWHPYRRKWATERKSLPLPDVMAAGGWKDTQTLLTCYQHADEQTMLRVMEAPENPVGRRRVPKS
jgi:integrase